MLALAHQVLVKTATAHRQKQHQQHWEISRTETSLHWTSCPAGLAVVGLVSVKSIVETQKRCGAYQAQSQDAGDGKQACQTRLGNERSPSSVQPCDRFLQQ